MEIQQMLMADHASVDPASGKLTISGAFNRVCAEQFPTTIRRFCIAIGIRGCRHDERANHRLLIKLVDVDGNELVGSEGTIRLPANGADIDPQFASVFEYNDIVINECGEHRFQVSINGGEIEETIAIPVVRQTA